jgi:uncharacterized protein YggE
MWKSVQTPFLTVLFIFVGLLLFVKFNGPIPFSVNSISSVKETSFTVTGKGEVTAVPDTALISMGVNKQAPSVETAKNQVNNIINKITDDLKNLGVEEKNIKTTDYSVNPNYDYANGSQKINGYSVNASVEVRLQPIDKANQAIDIATKDGATNVSGVQFVIDEKKQKDLQDEARKKAIDAAKEKAQSISSASGIRLGRLVDVQESNDDFTPRPMMAVGKAMDSAVAQAPTTELNPGQNKITSNVTLSYETYKAIFHN